MSLVPFTSASSAPAQAAARPRTSAPPRSATAGSSPQAAPRAHAVARSEPRAAQSSTGPDERFASVLAAAQDDGRAAAASSDSRNAAAGEAAARPEEARPETASAVAADASWPPPAAATPWLLLALEHAPLVPVDTVDDMPAAGASDPLAVVGGAVTDQGLAMHWAAAALSAPPAVLPGAAVGDGVASAASMAVAGAATPWQVAGNGRVLDGLTEALPLAPMEPARADVPVSEPGVLAPPVLDPGADSAAAEGPSGMSGALPETTFRARHAGLAVVPDALGPGRHSAANDAGDVAGRVPVAASEPAEVEAEATPSAPGVAVSRLAHLVGRSDEARDAHAAPVVDMADAAGIPPVSTPTARATEVLQRLAQSADGTGRRSPNDAGASGPAVIVPGLALPPAPAVQGAAAMAASVPPLSPAAGEQVTTQIVSSLKMQWKDGIGEARLHLRPDALGTVTVALRVEQGAVTAVVRADSPQVQDWVLQHQDSLRQQMEAAGLHLDELSVNPDDRGQHGQQDDAQPEPRRRRARAADADAPRFELLA